MDIAFVFEDWRVIFDDHGNVLHIEAIGPRGGVYGN